MTNITKILKEFPFYDELGSGLKLSENAQFDDKFFEISIAVILLSESVIACDDLK